MSPAEQPSASVDPSRASINSTSDDEGNQRHAGQVGYGPAYHQGPTLGDKFHGIKEEIKGKITGKPELMEKGRERKTGELARKVREEQDRQDPFANPQERQQKLEEEKRAQEERDKAAMEEAATVAPAGTPEAEAQRRGEVSYRVKSIG
ncbi:hypothetical protein FPV67DRAFT_1496178 [Lyophyllum atratum]|nr:hypothetical protein FPV67DRAFT_1496178 [Lyophyllum atratum]